MTRNRLLLLAGVLLLVALFFYFELHLYLSLELLQAQRATAVEFRDANPWLSAFAFLVFYIAVTGLSLPGAAILTLAAGAIFGLAVGLVIVSFASSIGATPRRSSRPVTCSAMRSRGVSKRVLEPSTAASARTGPSTCSPCGWCPPSRSSPSTWRWASRPSASGRSTGSAR